MSRSAKKIKAPLKLISLIEKHYVKNFMKRHRETALKNYEIASNIPRKFLNLKVVLEEKTPSTLVHNTVFYLSRGGGVIDFKDYVAEDQRGSFYVHIGAAVGENETLSEGDLKAGDLKVYFLSQSKKRKLGTEIFGSGCGRFMEISSYFDKTMRMDGIMVNSTDKRYLSVLRGTFFLVYISPKNDDLYLGSVTFEDTRYNEFICS